MPSIPNNMHHPKLQSQQTPRPTSPPFPNPPNQDPPFLGLGIHPSAHLPPHAPAHTMSTANSSTTSTTQNRKHSHILTFFARRSGLSGAATVTQQFPRRRSSASPAGSVTQQFLSGPAPEEWEDG